jgi:hypothetical protein
MPATQERLVLHVIFDGDDWMVKGEGGGAASSTHGSKDEAVAAAVARARDAGLGQVKIHKRNGSLEEERTFGDDPRRTPG